MSRISDQKPLTWEGGKFFIIDIFFNVNKSKMLVIARFNKTANVMLTYYTNKKLPVS